MQKCVLGLAGVFLLGACGSGGEEGGAEQVSAEPEPVSSAHQNVVWLPASDPLIPEHVNWHNLRAPFLTCGTGGARACTNRGKDFLRWHRNYVSRLRAKSIAMGRAASERTPWVTLKDDMAVWNASSLAVQEAYTNLVNNTNPNAGNQPFADENTFGTYLEEQMHNWLHGTVAGLYPPDQVVIGDMSPQSSYFFKIHGLVETLYQRWQRGKLVDSPYANVIFRNTTTGAASISTVSHSAGNISQASSTPLLPTVVPDSCNWYIGGVNDFDYDGNNDLIWHGPGCSQVAVWKMNGASFVNWLTPPSGVNNDWKLIGAADFSQDTQPDLVWAHNTQDLVRIWYMGGTTFSGFYTDYALPAGFRGKAIANFPVGTGTAPPLPPTWKNWGILIRSAAGQNRIVYYSDAGVLQNTVTLSTVSDANWQPVAMGLFHPNNLNVNDIGWQYGTTAAISFWKGAATGATYNTGSSNPTGFPNTTTVKMVGTR